MTQTKNLSNKKDSRNFRFNSNSYGQHTHYVLFLHFNLDDSTN
jgi:hypothetical protein